MTKDLFEIPRDTVNRKLAEQLKISVTEVERFSEEVRQKKLEENFDGYVLEDSNTKGKSFYKWY